MGKEGENVKRCVNYKNNALKNRQNRYLRTGKTDTERYKELRAETIEKISKCFYILLSTRYKVTDEKMDNINAIVDGYAMRYQTMIMSHNKEFADKWIKEQAEGAMDSDYVLPAVIYPKTRRQWDELNVKRDVGNVAVPSYVVAIRKELDFNNNKIRFLLNEFNSLYREA
ncbi:MAG: hypothetical protein Q4B86_07300 [Eubacteriales bacterium]|nr:hypothetical protein [Eubacteriales bacterium]